MYAIVKNNKVAEAPVNLKRSYKGKSGFHLLTDEERLTFGWYPLTLVNEQYDIISQNRSEVPNYEIFDNYVVGTYTITDKDEETIKTETNAKNKDVARSKIRDIKDIEDDLTDTKMLVQFMARGLISLYNAQSQEAKDNNLYKSGFEALSNTILGTDVRLDLETDQVERIIQIIKDESAFANIVDTEYKNKAE